MTTSLTFPDPNKRGGFDRRKMLKARRRLPPRP